MAKMLIVFGALVLAVGLYLSVTTNLPGALEKGLNGETENALIFDFVGFVFLIVGLLSRQK